jgi:alpha-D-ribose 1-methylphosphonate 5-triphosphate diphosphatase
MNAILPETVLINGQLVLENEVVRGNLVLRDGVIAEIDTSPSRIANAHDCEGSYIAPGLIELHTDNLERHLEPRPGVAWPDEAAAIAHDAELAGCGITTVFDAMRVGSIPSGTSRYDAYARRMVDVMLSLKAEDRLKISHFIHLRAEVCSETLAEELAAFGPDDRIGIVSLMDHTPGQRQFRDINKLKAYVTGKKNLDDAGFQAHVKMLMDLRTRNGDMHETLPCTEAERLCAVLASHDDTTEEHVQTSALRGVKVAEFPTTVEAAAACRKHGIAIMMGAPNLIRGGSHSGNVSALELAELDLLDIVSSDYVPAALFQSVLLLAELWGDLPKAMRTVTSKPAKAAGLTDRGQIAIGKRADLTVFRKTENFGHMQMVLCRGKGIFSPKLQPHKINIGQSVF